jgi:hypothetical protein
LGFRCSFFCAPQVGGGGGDGPEKEQKLLLGKIRLLPEDLQLRIGVLAVGIATREREQNLRIDEAVMLHAALADLEEEARDESEIEREEAVRHETDVDREIELLELSQQASNAALEAHIWD